MESCRSLFGLNCLQKIPTEDQSPGNSLNDRSSTKKFSAKRLLFEEDDDDGDATETTLTSQAISGFSYRNQLQNQPAENLLNYGQNFGFKRMHSQRTYSLTLPSHSLRATTSSPMSTTNTETSGTSQLGAFEEDSPAIPNFLALTKSTSYTLQSTAMIDFGDDPRTPNSCGMEIEYDFSDMASRCTSKTSGDSDSTSSWNNHQRLPTISNQKHSNLRTISAETMEELLTINKDNLSFLVIDCRYEYEYKGGHIKDAINIVDPLILERLFITNRDLLRKESYLKSLKKDFNTVMNSFPSREHYQNEPSLPSSPIIIFHCEYSAERGPRMHNYLRKIDREFNANRYPNLTYPEIYLLAYGYRNFSSKHQASCQPSGGYIEMKDPRFKVQYAEACHRDHQYWNKKGQFKLQPQLTSVSAN